MIKRIVWMMSLVGTVVLLMSCGREERERLEARVDSLQSELLVSRDAVQALQEVGTLIDSIDASRKILRTTMVEGTAYDDYVERMEDINKYVRVTERKLESLEKSLRSYKSTSSAYASTIKKLKLDLDKAGKEMIALQEMVTRYQQDNQNLVQTVSLKDAEIEDKINQVRIKEGELATLERRVDELLIQSRTDEADAYFNRAQVVEELAARTRFAPRKKKETRQEALELYRMALFLGKNEAQPRIAELERKL